MESVKGTRTEQNLLKAFAGESQASRRYKMFAKKAQEEGYEQIAAIFNETAINEDEHARIYFSFLEGGMVEITASYPAGVVGTTAENLAAADGKRVPVLDARRRCAGAGKSQPAGGAYGGWRAAEPLLG